MNDVRLLRHPRFEGQIVRPALKQERPCACAGFSLGRMLPDQGAVQFDFALVAMRFERLDGMDGVGRKTLEILHPVAREVAEVFDRRVIGVWAAWTRPEDQNMNRGRKRDAWLAGEAAALGLPYVSVTPIDGLCRWWRTWISETRDFPDLARRGVRVRGRACDGPLDNPRRVRAEWRARCSLVEKSP